MAALRKTKIVCTLGPATEDDAVLREMILSGMNVVRLNFSHGSYEGHAKNIRRVRALSQELHTPIGIMLDTKGPEIRLKTFREHRVTLHKGQFFTLCTDEVEGDNERVSITYANLPADVQPGTTILIDDGLVGLTVESVTQKEICCRVNNDGVVSDRKGINVPDANLSMPFISQKDRDDILFGIQQDVDFIAASFTRTEEDILSIRKGTAGTPGELRGVINYREENRIGTICGNSQYGIRGQMEPGKYAESMKKIPTGLKQEIQTGKAEIRCDIGDGIREYQCEILEIDSNARDTNKCFVLRITDDDLLSRTGGIVQGMSGSPVLQNGKLIGAITHVFVNDPTKGYGIFIENMME